jgi:hypothetical protein
LIAAVLDELGAALTACRAELYDAVDAHVFAAIALLREMPAGHEADRFPAVNNSRNVELLRSVNMQVRELADDIPAVTQYLFWCECEDTDCSSRVMLRLDEFDRTASLGDFVLARGHRLDGRSAAARRRAPALRRDAQAVRAEAQQARKQRRGQRNALVPDEHPRSADETQTPL